MRGPNGSIEVRFYCWQCFRWQAVCAFTLTIFNAVFTTTITFTVIVSVSVTTNSNPMASTNTFTLLLILNILSLLLLLPLLLWLLRPADVSHCYINVTKIIVTIDYYHFSTATPGYYFSTAKAYNFCYNF